jgi:hypothetical protein
LPPLAKDSRGLLTRYMQPETIISGKSTVERLSRAMTIHINSQERQEKVW